MRLARSTESLVTVKLGPSARLVIDALDFIGLWADVEEPEMDDQGALRFRVPREQLLAVILALDCHGITNVKAYEARVAAPSGSLLTQSAHLILGAE